ncbi:MAG: gamma-glutamyltransferase [Gemmatimonadetes bacterium]|nr:gamma-glutamyltransferase [Gemmatimonadota bacterium]
MHRRFVVSPIWAPVALLGLLLGCRTAPAGGPPSAVGYGSQAEWWTAPSQSRPDVRGATGAVSSGHPLATAAGYEVLRRGGNAVDAAITMAGVLAVVRPHMNGVGGDAFALIYDASAEEVIGLNGSGRAGALAEPSFFHEAGHPDAIPEKGALSVSVPGAVAAWADALERFGTITLAEALEPAIRYAAEGFPISKRLGSDMMAGSGALNAEALNLFLPGGEPPQAGTLLTNPALAVTLRAIASQGKDSFYRGAAAESISAYLEREGGYLREEDFAAHTSTWVDPLSTEYEGHQILVMPPNTQGFAQLQILEMAESRGVGGLDPAGAEYLHTLIELKKLAFADRNQWAADPEFVEIPLDRLLDSPYLEERSQLVAPDRAAADVSPGLPVGKASSPDQLEDSGDTVYLTAVDQWGNAVSWIQSLFNSFGSGILEPGSGVVLQNRGALFSLDSTHPNIVAPGKRPYHTLTPLMALRDGDLAFTLGTPGGDGQTQSLTQIINNLLLFGLTPQEAIEAPRFRSYPGLDVAIEDRMPPATLEELARRGHSLRVVPGWTATFGGAQMIMVEAAVGTLVVASDPRREAYGLAY